MGINQLQEGLDVNHIGFHLAECTQVPKATYNFLEPRFNMIAWTFVFSCFAKHE